MISSLANARHLFAIPDYRRMWGIGALSGGARWLEFVAVAIFTYETTRSPALVALLSVLRMMPYVALGIFMGALADRIERRRLLITSIVMMIAVSVAMSAAAETGMLTYGLVATAFMIGGAFWTVDMPVRRRLLVDAAGEERIAAALGFDNSTMYAMRAIGPLVGGATYQLLGVSGIFMLVAACYVTCLALALASSRQERPPAAQPSGTRLGMLLPPRSLLADRRFQVIMGVTLVFNLWCFPFVSMVPVIAQKDFAMVPALVGAMSAIEGVGGTAGALVIASVARAGTLFRFYYFGTTLFLCLVLLLSQLLTVATSVLALLAIGASAAAFSATQYALIHVIAPPEMRGRATGVLSVFIGSSMLGHYHTGWLFERLGSAAAMQLMAFEGLALIAVLGLLWTRTTGVGRAA